MIAAPPAEQFPAYPSSWYLFGRAREIRRRPISKTLLGRRLVCFRTDDGQLAILDARCAHLGADLSRGCVVGETIICPFHNRRYGADGRCAYIPASAEIPAFARVRSYPVVERHGFVYFFNGPRALFPLPFFPDADPEEFIASEPFKAELECPWWMIGANVFDMQHFRAAHERKMIGEPQVECPSPYARSVAADFTVLGESLRDCLVRRLAGEHVRMSFTDWCGNIIFATPTFRRTTSYGMLITDPLGPGRVRVTGTVFVRKRQGLLGRLLIDPLHVRIRRYFIQAFLQSDARLGRKGLRYNPEALLECDRELIDYFQWLASLPVGGEDGLAAEDNPCNRFPGIYTSGRKGGLWWRVALRQWNGFRSFRRRGICLERCASCPAARSPAICSAGGWSRIALPPASPRCWMAAARTWELTWGKGLFSAIVCNALFITENMGLTADAPAFRPRPGFLPLPA